MRENSIYKLNFKKSKTKNSYEIRSLQSDQPLQYDRDFNRKHHSAIKNGKWKSKYRWKDIFSYTKMHSRVRCLRFPVIINWFNNYWLLYSFQKFIVIFKYLVCMLQYPYVTWREIPHIDTMLITISFNNKHNQCPHILHMEFK